MPQPKPRKPGRPKLPKGEAKGKIVALRFDPDHLKRIDAAAKARKLNRSEWIRSTLDAGLGA
jgi:uncharacterized protein (DUF1778 family)